jgi:TonB family protein
MREATGAMTLTAPEEKPWHLRARYKRFAPDGSVTSEIVMEIWWADSEHSKTTYTGQNYTRTEYWNGESTSFTGSDKLPAIPKHLLFRPLPSSSYFDNVTFTTHDLTIGTNDLRCYTQASKDPSITTNSASYCFDKGSSRLRIEENSINGRVLFNGIVSIYGHYVAKQISQSTPQADPSMTIDVDLLETQLGIEEAALAPPPDASPLGGAATSVVAPHMINLSPGVVQGYKIGGEPARYPLDAQRARIQGTVVLRARIGKDGTVKDLQVLSGPPILQDAAVESVKTWRYKPYLHNGNPVEIQTMVNVVFNLAP